MPFRVAKVLKTGKTNLPFPTDVKETASGLKQPELPTCHANIKKMEDKKKD